jgi:hypothetical protein
MDLTSDDIIKLSLSALGGGIVAAVINNAVTTLRERGTTKRAGIYAAIRVAVILESFAIECAERLSDSIADRTSGGEMGKPYTSLASLSEYPTDVEWKALNAPLAARALSFRNEVRLSEGALSEMADIEPGEVQGECERQAGKCGYRAWQLASGLRSAYRLPPVEPHQTHWDAVTLLRQWHDGALKEVTPREADKPKE